jgi:pimeloyl-ACP methyl ester carboxylesterase
VKRAAIDGIELEYEITGADEPVVLIHAGVLGAGWFTPLLGERVLSDRYRLLSYNRAGYGGSSRPRGPVTIAQHAAHCRELMRHVGMDQAHIVGHSSSAMIALQLALDSPETVRTLALFESARPAVPTETQREFSETVVEPALQSFGRGDKAGAVDTWMRGVCGPRYRDVLDEALPGGFDQAVDAADAFFGQELPAVQQWSFTQEDAKRITQPVLAVLGANSARTFAERRELLLAWLPDVEPFDLPDATHLLQVENPHGMAEGLAHFFARHPVLTTPSTAG